MPLILPLDTACALALFGGLARQRREVAAIAYLAADWRVLALRHVAGGVDRVAPRTRAIARDAVMWEAAGIVIAHNHPSGAGAPSREDLRYARTLRRVLATLGVTLIDQLVVAGTEVTSLRRAGLL